MRKIMSGAPLAISMAVAFPAMVASMEDYFAGTATTLVNVRKKRSDPETQRLALP